MKVYKRDFNTESNEDILEWLRIKDILDRMKKYENNIIEYSVRGKGWNRGDYIMEVTVYVLRKSKRTEECIELNGFTFEGERRKHKFIYCDNYVPVKALVRVYKEISCG